MATKVKFTTPFGVARYPHISSPDTKGKFADNKFKTKLVYKIDDPAALAAIEKIDEAAIEIHGKAGVSTAEQKSAIRRRKTRPSCYMPGGVA